MGCDETAVVRRPPKSDTPTHSGVRGSRRYGSPHRYQSASRSPACQTRSVFAVSFR